MTHKNTQLRLDRAAREADAPPRAITLYRVSSQTKPYAASLLIATAFSMVYVWGVIFTRAVLLFA